MHYALLVAALATQVSGCLSVSFVVQANGSVSVVMVSKKKRPAWYPKYLPAVQAGKTIYSLPVRFIQPITFKL